MARLYLISGLPGAGKTSRAKAIEARTGATRFCPDEWMLDLGIDVFDEAFRARLERRMLVLAEHLLARGQSVIVEFGSWSRAERGALRELARRAGADVELHFLDAEPEELARRIAARNGPDAAMLTEAVLRRLSDHIERPTPEELATFDASKAEE